MMRALHRPLSDCGDTKRSCIKVLTPILQDLKGKLPIHELTPMVLAPTEPAAAAGKNTLTISSALLLDHNSTTTPALQVINSLPFSTHACRLQPERLRIRTTFVPMGRHLASLALAAPVRLRPLPYLNYALRASPRSKQSKAIASAH